MNLRRIVTAFCVLTLGTTAFVNGQEPVPKLTEEHQILAQDVGVWDATIKSYMEATNAEPKTSKGTESNSLLSGGLWLVTKFEGNFGGLPFEGRGLFGYDTLKKRYVGTWVDSMSPNLSLLEGTYDAKTKTITYVGDGIDSSSKAKYTQRMVTTLKDDGTRHFTLYMKLDQQEKEAKLMEITYTKRK